jgi:hypothetical protein
MQQILREPLLHFLLLGAGLFAAYGWLNQSGGAPNEIIVSHGQLESLRAQFERTWQRPPTEQELGGLVEGWVREEILYREGVALGFDRDDPVVRRRIAQKMEFLADGNASNPPSQIELDEWLEQHRADYRIDAVYSFRQVFFDPSRHDDRLEADLDVARKRLASGNIVEGDSTLLPASLDRAPSSEVTRIFGAEFARALGELQGDGWQGPIRSGFGVHLVEVTALEAARDATLAEVRDAVERDLLHTRAKQANEAFYGKLRNGYVVRIGDAPQ